MSEKSGIEPEVDVQSVAERVYAVCLSLAVKSRHNTDNIAVLYTVLQSKLIIAAEHIASVSVKINTSVENINSVAPPVKRNVKQMQFSVWL